ncbi:hypothetical protein [Ornithinibacillus scapharcae]|uniref:hypothetical protein n=1 Tax=Ornithinibacillus scapharcae TaxID=1147159 RepID=UPI000225BE20|nr:hypothetical protein [Ornithinibacillus scapharcae]
MNTFVYFFLGFGYLFLLLWSISLTRKEKHLKLSNIILLVIIGLIYDNFIIALGSCIGEGSLLENLSYPRYWLHALFTPTLILFAWSICMEAEISLAKKTFVKVIAFLLTLCLIGYELFTSVIGIELSANWENGLLTYESSSQSMNGVMVIVVTTVLVGVGFILWRRLHFPWLFIGTLLMIFGSGIGLWMKDFPVMNILEFILLFSLVLAKRFTNE